MRSLVLMILIILTPTVNGQERFLYAALPAYNQPGPSSFYFDTNQPPSFDYGSPQAYASNTLVSPFASNSPQSNAITSFPQTLDLTPFDFPQPSANAGYQQPLRPFEGFELFRGNQQFSSFSGFPQNNQGFGINQGPMAPPQFLFPTASNQQFSPSPFRNILSQGNQFPPQKPQFTTITQNLKPFQNTYPFIQQQIPTQPQQSQFPTNNPFQQPALQSQPETVTGIPTQPQQTGPATPSQGNQLRPIKGIFGPGQPGQFDAPKEYIIPL